MKSTLHALRCPMLLCLVGLGSIAAVRADDSWKKPLAIKEREIEAGIRKRHNVLGLYPSMVEIPRSGEFGEVVKVECSWLCFSFEANLLLL